MRNWQSGLKRDSEGTINWTNCYWSILLPLGKRMLTRVVGQEHMWLFRPLPFGWSYDPLLC